MGRSPDAATAVNTTTTDDILDRWLAAASERYLADLTMPELSAIADPQRYVCIEPLARYRFESLDTDFVREIEVDTQGLVLAYPGLFKRVE